MSSSLDALHGLSQTIETGTYEAFVSSSVFHGQWRLQFIQERVDESSSERWFGVLLGQQELQDSIKNDWPDKPLDASTLKAAVEHITNSFEAGLLDYEQGPDFVSLAFVSARGPKSLRFNLDPIEDPLTRIRWFDLLIDLSKQNRTNQLALKGTAESTQEYQTQKKQFEKQKRKLEDVEYELSKFKESGSIQPAPATVPAKRKGAPNLARHGGPIRKVKAADFEDDDSDD